MALHFPLQVNGTVIGYFVATRRELVIPDDGICTYDVEIETRHSAVVKRQAFWHGTIRHDYHDGSWALIQSALTTMLMDPIGEVSSEL